MSRKKWRVEIIGAAWKDIDLQRDSTITDQYIESISGTPRPRDEMSKREYAVFGRDDFYTDKEERIRRCEENSC